MKHDDSPNDAQGKAHIADEPIAHDALVRARESLDALLAHERTTGAASKGIEVRARVFNEALHLHIWWTGVSSRMGTEFLWDDLCVKPGGPELMQSLRQALEGTSVGGRTLGWKDLDPGQIVRPTAEPPMFRYEPQRVRTQLPFGKRLAQLARVPGVAHDGESFVQVSQAGLKELGNVVFSSMGPMARLLNPGPQSSVRARTRSLDTDPTGHQDAIRCFTEFVRFEAAGRHIFDFPDRLSAMFRRTDVEDMPGELLKLPYKAFYMCFGPSRGSKFGQVGSSMERTSQAGTTAVFR